MTNPKYLELDAATLAAQLADLLASYPELAEDDELRQDMIEGETNAFSILERIISQEREANSQSAAIKTRQDELAARRQRAERKKQAMRTLAFKVMKAGNLTKVPLSEATLSISNRAGGVEIVDEAALPKWAIRVSYEPDKTAIKEALQLGKKVKGAKIGDPTESLTVRVA